MPSAPATHIRYRYPTIGWDGRRCDLVATADPSTPLLVTLPDGVVVDLLARPTLWSAAGAKANGNRPNPGHPDYDPRLHGDPVFWVDTDFVRCMRQSLAEATPDRIATYIPAALAVAGRDNPVWQRHDAAIVAEALAEELKLRIVGAVWCDRDRTVRRLDIVTSDAAPGALATLKASISPFARAAIADGYINVSRPAEIIANGGSVPPGVYTTARAALRDLRAADGELVLDRDGGDPRIASDTGARMPDDVVAAVRQHLGACIEIVAARESWADAVVAGQAIDPTPLIISAAMEEADRAATRLSMAIDRSIPLKQGGIDDLLTRCAALDLLPSHVDPATGWPMPPDIGRWLAAPDEIRAGWAVHTEELRRRLLAQHAVTVAELRAAGFEPSIVRSPSDGGIKIAMDPIIHYDDDDFPGYRSEREKEARERRMGLDLWLRISYSAARLAAEIIAQSEADCEPIGYMQRVSVQAPESMRGALPKSNSPTIEFICQPVAFCPNAAAEAFVTAAGNGTIDMSRAVRSFATAVNRQPGLCDIQAEAAQQFMAAAADLVKPLSLAELADMDGSTDRLKIPNRLTSAHEAACLAGRLDPVWALGGISDAIEETPEVRAAILTILAACRKAGYVDDAKSAA